MSLLYPMYYVIRGEYALRLVVIDVYRIYSKNLLLSLLVEMTFLTILVSRLTFLRKDIKIIVEK